MPLLLPVLVRGINNLSDARYCAGMGADGLIFTLDPSLPGAVDAATVKELAGWVSGVELIGEFGNMPASEINRLVSECGLTRVMLNLHQRGPEGILVPLLLEAPHAALLDGHHYTEFINEFTPLMPQGFAFVAALPYRSSYTSWHTFAQRAPIWFAGPVSPDTALELAKSVQPAGLILNGGDEIKPGLRDFTELEAIFEALEE